MKILIGLEKKEVLLIKKLGLVGDDGYKLSELLGVGTGGEVKAIKRIMDKDELFADKVRIEKCESRREWTGGLRRRLVGREKRVG